MSREYDNYLENHKVHVAKGFYWLRDNLPEVLELYYGNIGDLEHQICFAHDDSKTEPDEYEPYDRYFYGGNRSYAVVQEYNVAWLKHIHRNPHHWQHWILVFDDPENEKDMEFLDMPINYIIEMICDWWAFSWDKGDLTEMFKWYEEHEAHIKFSSNTRGVVQDILGRIRSKLEEVGTKNANMGD